MKVGSSYVAQTGWGLYENILGDYVAKTGTPRFRSEREIFVFFNRFWKRMRKDYSFVNDQPMEDEHPSVPAMLALGVYPIVLAVALVGGLLFFFLFR